MKHVLLFLFVALQTCCFSLHAQSVAGKITGVVKDAQGSPVAGALIRLLNSKDSVVIKTTAADDNGKFSFKGIREGAFIVEADGVGYSRFTSGISTIDISHLSIQLPVIVLQATTANNLQKVTVTYKKPLIEQKIDRTIVNVDAMITAAGSNTLEVLAKSPGVMIDMNGNISLNGKSGVLVLIDDKPTYMSAQNLADYLRSLPAGVLDRLELMSNPPAKYDASGSAIINIVLKKNRATGFNGNISLGYNQGVYARSNNSININYRDKKFNFFGNLSFSNGRTFNDNNDIRYFYNTQGFLDNTLLMGSYSTSYASAWNARAGMDYFVSPKTTLGIMLMGNIRPKTDRLGYNSSQYGADSKLDSTGSGFTAGDYKWKSGGINLNMQHKFDSAGKTITADIDYINYNSNGNQVSPDYMYLPDGNLSSSNTRLFTLPSMVNIYSVKSDYTQPLKANARMDAGLKSSYVTNNNQLNWFDKDGDTYIPDYGKSDHFIYSEQVNAAYLNAVKEWKRWAVQAGVRIENTNATGKQVANAVIPDSVFHLHYTKVFPTFYLLYKLDSSGNNTVKVSYSKRIRRPGYQQLNPFLFYHDEYTYTSGNPALTPEYGSFVELHYSYKQYISVTFTYGMEKYLIYPTTQAVGSLFITRPQNFSSRHFMGVIPNLSVSPAKWWSINLNAVVLFFVNRSDGDSVKLTANTNMHEIEVFNQFHFNCGWSAELTGFFPGRQSFGQTVGGPVYNISAGVQKTILKNKASVRLKMDDIFHTMNPIVKTVGINQVAAMHTGKSDTRQLGISFTYRFGKDANARKRNHNTGGTGDEEKRVN